MKNKFFYIFIYFILILETWFADTWIFWNSVSTNQIREWDIHINDIPNIIKWAIDFFIGIAWTISIIFIIIWAYQVMFWTFSWDKSKWKTTITMALWWFIIAALAWFIISFLIENLS